MSWPSINLWTNHVFARKQFTPNIFNSLEPYYNTDTPHFLIETVSHFLVIVWLTRLWHVNKFKMPSISSRLEAEKFERRSVGDRDATRRRFAHSDISYHARLCTFVMMLFSIVRIRHPANYIRHRHSQAHTGTHRHTQAHTRGERERDRERESIRNTC